MYDYGNARVAARRSRLVDPAILRRLADAPSPAALVVLLGTLDDWRPVLADVSSLAADPVATVEAAIERHRSRRLSALLRWYPAPARALVEALVLPLDVERLLAVLRRRRAGDPPETIGAAVSPGALLDAAAIGRLARARTTEAMLLAAAGFGLLSTEDARVTARLATPGTPGGRVEGSVVAAADAARLRRAAGRGADARLVRAALEREIAIRAAAAAAARESGVATGTLVERSETLGRLAALEALGRRDRLGIGAVAGYVAAVELQAIRLRAVLAGVAAGWTPGLVGEYLDPPRPAAAPARA